MTVYICYI